MPVYLYDSYKCVNNFVANILQGGQTVFMKTDKRSTSSIIPVKLDADLASRIRALAEEVGEPDSTIMRLAIRAGLPKVKSALDSLRSEDAKPTELRYTHRP